MEGNEEAFHIDYDGDYGSERVLIVSGRATVIPDDGTPSFTIVGAGDAVYFMRGFRPMHLAHSRGATILFSVTGTLAMTARRSRKRTSHVTFAAPTVSRSRISIHTTTKWTCRPPARVLFKLNRPNGHLTMPYP